MLRVVRWSAIGLIAVILIGWGVVWLGGFGGNAGTSAAGIAGNVQVGGPFTLVDTTGKTVSDTSFRGKWMLVYFGYTYCPDVCPTELQAMAAGMDKLGPLAANVAPLFITVDPERDTADTLAEYVKLFDDRLIGLTGTPAQIATAAKAYRVYYAKITPKDASSYLMDHSSFLYLMGPDGQLRMLFKPGTSGSDIAEAIRTRMTAS